MWRFAITRWIAYFIWVLIVWFCELAPYGWVKLFMMLIDLQQHKRTCVCSIVLLLQLSALAMQTMPDQWPDAVSNIISSFQNHPTLKVWLHCLQNRDATPGLQVEWESFMISCNQQIKEVIMKELLWLTENPQESSRSCVMNDLPYTSVRNSPGKVTCPGGKQVEKVACPP